MCVCVSSKFLSLLEFNWNFLRLRVFSLSSSLFNVADVHVIYILLDRAKCTNEQTSPFSNKIKHVLAHESHTQSIATHTPTHILILLILLGWIFFARIFLHIFLIKCVNFSFQRDRHTDTEKEKNRHTRTHTFDVKDENTPEVSESVTKNGIKVKDSIKCAFIMDVDRHTTRWWIT